MLIRVLLKFPTSVMSRPKKYLTRNEFDTATSLLKCPALPQCSTAQQPHRSAKSDLGRPAKAWRSRLARLAAQPPKINNSQIIAEHWPQKNWWIDPRVHRAESLELTWHHENKKREPGTTAADGFDATCALQVLGLGQSLWGFLCWNQRAEMEHPKTAILRRKMMIIHQI